MAWLIECKTGEQESFDCCDGVTTSNFLFAGLLITKDDLSQVRIFSPFEVFISTSAVYISDYKGNGLTINLSDTAYSTMSELTSALGDCQKCDCDQGGSGSGEGGLQLVRQVFSDHTGPSVTLTENGGVFPVDTSEVQVYFNGRLMTENSDYSISGSNVNFSFDIVKPSEVQLVFFVRAPGIADVLRQVEAAFSGTTLTVTMNGGTIPSDTDQLFVYLNGRLMTENSDYSISGSNVNFSFDVRNSVVTLIMYV